MKRNWKFWICIGSAIALIALVVIVFMADDSVSVRVGAWAQFVATLGTVFAAALAFRTADANRLQAKDANQAMAVATRPQLSLNVTPKIDGPPLGDKEFDLRLTIINQSQFDVKDGRVEWELKNGVKGEHKFGPIFAAANPESGLVSEHVSYAGDRKSHEYVGLGSQENFTPGTMRVTLYYTSIFSNGEWMEIHYWKTSDINKDSATPHWRMSHTYEPPLWIPASA
ncbi:hypothetical protein [Brevibacterium aurantiacum]|uniref:Uncharacterized protein n=1 Tax=Brevibacterium aurantiacum TaxID=273384 RepID=A0A556C585_BREAU|nr:hypothetical protein [Brevibacterium aurantiacum]TSI12617.1 hypothetical protein FO013_19270 [Brevibacterium aurantiacum]